MMEFLRSSGGISPPGDAADGLRLRYAPPRSIGPHPYPLWPFGPSPPDRGSRPRTPITGDAYLLGPAIVPARKIWVTFRLSFRPTGAWVSKNFRFRGSIPAPGFAEQTVPGPLTAGGPRASPTQTRKFSLKTVGEGLAPPAGRSGTGPYEKNASAPLFVVGAGPRPARQPSPLGEGAERMRGG